MSTFSLRRLGGLIAIGALVVSGCTGTKGTDGKNCSVTNNGNGSATISCPDGTSTTISNGTNGTDGTAASCTIVSNPNGSKTITCSDGTTVTLTPGVVDFKALTSADLIDLDPSAVVTNVTIGLDGRPTIYFRVNDRHGNGIKNFVPSVAATGVQPTTVNFMILKLADPGVNGSANQTWVSYNAGNATSTASAETQLTAISSPYASNAVVTDNGDGSYVFKMARDITNAAAAGTTYEPTKIHRVTVLLYTSGHPYAPINAVFDFVPATGQVLDPNAQEVVDGNACLSCHASFRAKPLGTGKFHGGGRYDVRICVTCHNDQRRFTALTGSNQDSDAPGIIDPTGAWTGTLVKVNGEATINLPAFIHRLHMGENLTLTGGNYAGISQPYEITFPQDVRNCQKCHVNVGRAADWNNVPSRRACNACHDYVTFTGLVLNGRRAHTGGTVTDDVSGAPGSVGCNGCHPPAAIQGFHTPAGLPNPLNYYATGSTSNANTNAGWTPASGALPPGASLITYEVDSVTTTAAGNPQIIFRMMRQDPTDTASNFVTFNATTSTEMVDHFVGSTSVYFVFAVPQSGVVQPDDWNGAINAYLKSLWKGTGGTLTGPTTRSGKGGWYTATITNGIVPSSARLLTGGVGYSYSLSSTPPLTQIDPLGLPTGATWMYPWNDPANATSVTCGPTRMVGVVPGVTVACDSPAPFALWPKMGGLVVTAPNVSKTATGHTARRVIVDTNKCKSCHGQLGSVPNFHAGNRNDGATCAFCHNPNRANQGWSLSSKYFIHAIHGTDKRTVGFTYDSDLVNDDGVIGVDGFLKITYPGIINRCTQCHLDPAITGSGIGNSTFDFSVYLSNSANSIEDLLPITAATGKFDPANVNSFQYSPYVAVDNTTDYGKAFSFTASSGTWYDPESDATGLRSLVHSPIAGACFSCHDTDIDVGHFRMYGASIYAPLSSFTPGQEACLLCHGKGGVAAIQDVHQ